MELLLVLLLRNVSLYMNREMKHRYHHERIIHNTKSAESIVPIIMEIVNPKKVIDVGCGLGAWLKVFKNYGVEEICGIDGGLISEKDLYIEKEFFINHDLRKPYLTDNKYDLVLCLEVGEHLPDNSADTLVKTLVSLGDTILFSAAIPNQGGQNHINEQWPGYWVEKFQKYGFNYYDIIRPKIWNNKDVFFWYKQNILVFSNYNFHIYPVQPILNAIHPTLYKMKIHNYEDLIQGKQGIKKALSILCKSIYRKFL